MDMDAFDRQEKAIILVVDDEPDNRSLLVALLGKSYRVALAGNGEECLRIAASAAPPDLILLDVLMPDIDGYEVCRRLQDEPKTRTIPVIFLTARSSPEDEQRGLALGAVDYVGKPISPAILLARVATQLSLKASIDQLRNQNALLVAEVARRTSELEALQEVTILAMASLAEARDSETGKHLLRTQRYVKALAEKLRPHPRFSTFLTDDKIRLLFRSAPLHDIGKVGIPDRILLKPGRYEPHELAIMKNHTLLGRDAIQLAEDWLGGRAEFLTIAKEIALYHQEKWDGSGYPESLTGDSIPVSARLMAIADVYDALISRRVYKEQMPHEQAAQIIIDGRGRHFDPDMVDAFVEIQDEFRTIALTYPDLDSDLQKKIEFLAQAVADEA
ncbi:two-component system response regulator [Candidatus Accumulibacter sp. ACC003]|uniref:response regulator n=1 Tax=Candidatus Accumulibacter sp. ACC003 TaxID=2823334 RepID=UPI0025BC8EB6|nr:two-component system response regulator [Candidatus Accumulibacter sp. ACC003]